MNNNIFDAKRQKLVKELQELHGGARRCVEQKVKYFTLPAEKAEMVLDDALFVMTGANAMTWKPRTEREQVIKTLHELTDEEFDALVYNVREADNEMFNNVQILINDASFSEVFSEKQEEARRERAKKLLSFYRVLMGEHLPQNDKGGQA